MTESTMGSALKLQVTSHMLLLQYFGIGDFTDSLTKQD